MFIQFTEKQKSIHNTDLLLLMNIQEEKRNSDILFLCSSFALNQRKKGDLKASLKCKEPEEMN